MGRQQVLLCATLALGVRPLHTTFLAEYSFGMTLPKFTGNVLDYTDFKREFKSRVESMILDDDARASYLKSEHVIPVETIRNLLKECCIQICGQHWMKDMMINVLLLLKLNKI